MTLSVPVDTGVARYDIRIGAGLLNDPASWDGLPSSRHAVIVTNTTIAPLWAARLAEYLSARHAHLSVLELPDGEAHKDWPALNSIFDHLLQRGCDRKTVLYALDRKSTRLNSSHT